jgi:hypothetical protein
MNYLSTKKIRKRSIFEIITVAFVVVAFALAITSGVGAFILMNPRQGKVTPRLQTLDQQSSQPQTLYEEASHAFLAALDSHVLVRDKSFFMQNR